jgi:hypothetical protein
MKIFFAVLSFIFLAQIANGQSSADSLVLVPAANETISAQQKETIIPSKINVKKRKLNLKKSINNLLLDKFNGLKDNIFFEAIEKRTKEVVDFVKASM